MPEQSVSRCAEGFLEAGDLAAFPLAALVQLGQLALLAVGQAACGLTGLLDRCDLFLDLEQTILGLIAQVLQTLLAADPRGAGGCAATGLNLGVSGHGDGDDGHGHSKGKHGDKNTHQN